MLDRYCNFDYITDEQIDKAEIFDGWCDDYLSWPAALWDSYTDGVPSSNLNANAYHIQYLANEMASAGAWIGRPIKYWPNGAIKEGNHRYRALKYLSKKGIIIEVECSS